MATENSVGELAALRERIAGLEAELAKLRQIDASPDRPFSPPADALPAMVWTAGPDARYTYFNSAWLEFRGRTLAEELGSGWTEGVHPDDRDIAIEAYLKAFTARQSFRMQYRLQRADGEYCWIEDLGAPRFDGDQAFTGYVGVAMEIRNRTTPGYSPDEESVRLVFALTERERQVLVLISQGKSTKQTAAHLGISYKTADSHRSRILEKLGVHETASMVRYAIRAGLIEA